MLSSSRRSKRSSSFPSLSALTAAKKEHSKKTDGDEADSANSSDLASGGNDSLRNVLFALYSTLLGTETRNPSSVTDILPQRPPTLPKLTPRRRLSLTIAFFLLTLLLFILATTFGSPFSPSPPLSSSTAAFNRTNPNSKQSSLSAVGLTSDGGNRGILLKKRGAILTQSRAKSRNPLTWLWGTRGGGEESRGKAGDGRGARQSGLAGVPRARRLRAAVVVCQHKLTECQETLRVCEEKERSGGLKSTERKRSSRTRLRGVAKCDLRAKAACQSLATLCREAHRSLKEQEGWQASWSTAIEAEDEEEEDLAEEGVVRNGPPDCSPFSTLDKERRCVCPALYTGRKRCVRRDWREVEELKPLLVPEVYNGDFLLSVEALRRVERETGSSQLKVNLPEKEIPWRIVWEPGPDGSRENFLPSLLAQRDPVRGGHVHKTCAVVGNSGLLLMERLGREIDAHSAVFRFNGAPTVGFEAHVGSKTTFRLVNSKWYKFRETEEEMVIFQSRSGSHFLKYINLLVSSEHLGEPFYLMAPEFTTWLARTAHNLSSLVRPPRPDPGGSGREGAGAEEPPMEFIPTSGWIGLMMALQICRKVTLYGFQVSEAHGMPYHYHNQCSQPHGERDKIEWRLVRGIVEAKLASFGNPCVSLCHRSMKECKRCMSEHISPSKLAEGMALWSSLPLPDYCLKQQQEAASNGEDNNFLLVIPDWMETGLPTG